MVTFTATVTDGSGPMAPTGHVEFYDGATDLGGGSALNPNGASATSTLTISTLALGSHSIEAVYTPSGAFTASQAGMTQTVEAGTTTALVSSDNPATPGQPVTFTATVSNDSGAGGAPTGQVEFFDGATDLGPGSALTGGGASATSTLTISTLSLGSHAIRAVYTPTGDFQSGSALLTQTVDAMTGVGVTSNDNPSEAGQAVTFTATVTNTSGVGGTPTGTVEFYDGATYLGAGGALAGSGASAASSLTISTLSAGGHDIEAVYTPGGDFFGGSAALTQTVDAVTTTAVASNDNPAALGQSVTFTATVTDASGGAPTGTVEFFAGATDLGPESRVDRRRQYRNLHADDLDIGARRSLHRGGVHPDGRHYRQPGRADADGGRRD